MLKESGLLRCENVSMLVTCSLGKCHSVVTSSPVVHRESLQGSVVSHMTLHFRSSGILWDHLVQISPIEQNPLSTVSDDGLQWKIFLFAHFHPGISITVGQTLPSPLKSKVTARAQSTRAGQSRQS